MNIKTIRRISQIVFFILIIYGGFLVSSIFSVQSKELARGMEGDINIVDASLPTRTCRYIYPKPAFFESCALKYLLDRPLYLGPLLPIALYILIILALCFVFARFMCGWMCPLGLISDMLDLARRALRMRNFTLPDRLKKALRYWRYSFLLFLVFLSLALITPMLKLIYMDKNFYAVSCQVCPARIIFPIFGGVMPTMPSFLTLGTAIFSALSLVFLLIFVSGLAITRVWCRICPNGTFNSLFSKGALVAKNKDVRKCTKCGICKRVCPFNNDHVFEEKNKKGISHPNCIMCFNCVEKCPEDGCLDITFSGKRIFSSRFKKK